MAGLTVDGSPVKEERPMRVWLIGENNPYSDEPRYDLFPYPDGSAGARLCHHVLGLAKHQYLARFERRNLLRSPKWSAPVARWAADDLLEEVPVGDRLILLGSKVAAAFRAKYAPFEVAYDGGEPRLLVLPHPSGRCRAWREPDSFKRAREAVTALCGPGYCAPA